MPIMAQTAIKASAYGLKTGEITFEVNGFKVPAYFAARQGDARKYTETAKLMSELVSKVPDAQVMSDLDGAVKWAGANGGDLKKIAITGFCWGGRITWLYAEQSKNVKAGVGATLAKIVP